MNKLDEICNDIYKEMYKVSHPHANFNTLDKSKSNWYLYYFLPIWDQMAIIEKHGKQHKLSTPNRNKLRKIIFIGCSPNRSESTWKELTAMRDVK